MTRTLTRLMLKAVLAVASGLFLAQLDLGWYGLMVNWGLLLVIILVSFHLGYWGME